MAMGNFHNEDNDYIIPDIPGKVEFDDYDRRSSPKSASMYNKSGIDHFTEVPLRYGNLWKASLTGTTFTSNIGHGGDDKMNLPQLSNGVYKSKGFDEDFNSYRAFGNEKNSKSPEKDFTTEVTTKLNSVPFFELFRFSNCQDKIFIFFALIAAVCGGCTMPAMVVLFGGLANAFVSNSIDPATVCESLPQCCPGDVPNFNATTCNLSDDKIKNFSPKIDFFAEIEKFGAGTGCIGLINFVMGYIFVTCLNHAAESQVFRIRGLFLQSILRQDIGWYDTHQTGDFASKMTEDLNKLQEGIGEKIGIFIFFITVFLVSIVNAFVHGWELTLVILAPMPILSISLGLIGRSQATLAEREVEAYGKAGAIAEEVLSAIRTVVAFGGQQKEAKRYKDRLLNARKAGIMRGLLTGVGGGLMWLIIYSSYALAFWYGVKLIMDDRETCLKYSSCEIRYDPASLLIVFFSVLMGAMNLGQAAPYMESFSMAKSAAASIFAVIDRVPEIDTLIDKGDILPEGARDIVFENVYFNYPSRQNVNVLSGLNLRIKKGETVALVGSSGCGKSTCIQLLQRFYDPFKGCIRLGGRDIRELSIAWLRKTTGVVGQEPVLFGYTIEENIKLGREGITKKEIEKACKDANAYDFIMKLPQKFETLVGEKGAQLSGGQKQRIAIARALVRNPEILLLDEATSALDTQSESVVQAALDKARAGRTTIVVAHRLSTIRSADTIVALKDGNVAEKGTHAELMKLKGLYFSLVTAQMSQENNPFKEEFENMATDMEAGGLINEYTSMSLPNSLGRLDSFSSIPWSSFRRKPLLDRNISLNSILSSDSADILEETGRAVGTAVGIARMTSTSFRKSRRIKPLDSQDPVEKITLEEDEDLPDVGPFRILKTNSPEWIYILIGSIASVVMGASMPIYAILFGEVLGILSDPIDEARIHSITYSALFVVVGVVVGLSMFLQITMFAIAGEHLTNRMRNLAFVAMLHQEMAWFDQPVNNTGALCARLSGDAAAIQGATGSQIGIIIQSLFTILLAIGASIYNDWKLGLVSSLFVPFVLVASAFQTKIVTSQENSEKKAFYECAKATGSPIGLFLQSVCTLGISIGLSISYQWKLGLVTSTLIPLILVAVVFQAKIIIGNNAIEKKAFEQSSKLAIEAITNIRTVASLCREKTFVDRYVEELRKPHESAKKKALIRGLVFGFAQAMPFFAYAGCMYYGGYLVSTENLPYRNVFKVAESLILGTMMVGQATAFAPNYNKAVIAAARIFKLLDRVPLINDGGHYGSRPNRIEGNVNVKDANFCYPNRPQVEVLKSLNLSISSGQKIALVGPSGCGKSTIIYLLQRFYNLISGEMKVDGHNLENLNVPWIRSRIGIVSQEPILFDGTLAENIQYGDNSRIVSMDEVVDAAKQANIHTFIASLPQGYATKLGEKGAQLSGGQKQRVAIARALVRNPDILLLDEATSALDTESERVVQEALDKAQEGRTAITIAHRLSTIQQSDRIFVVSKGIVAESGSHHQLLRQNGIYAKLWNKQSGNTKSKNEPSLTLLETN